MTDQGGTTAEPPSPDQSSLEIHALIQKLDPSSTTHKDRVRRLARFRNYVSSLPSTPEFYDDDIPILLLGSAATPSAGLYDYGLSDDKAATSGSTGLLHACGSPSQDHADMLKRSARYAMSLLRYLVCDHRDHLNGKAVPLNKDPATGQVELTMFAHALCCCTSEQLATLKLHWHMEDNDNGGKRSGAKDDACTVLVLLLTRHMSPDGMEAQPIPLQELLPTAKARKAFDMWLTSRRGPSKEVQKLIKTQQIMYTRMQKENKDSGSSTGDGTARLVDGSVSTDVAAQDSGETSSSPSKQIHSSASSRGGDATPTSQDRREVVATRWDQSQLNARSFKFTKTATTLLLGGEEPMEEKQQEEEGQDEEELKMKAEEKKRILSRDPLGMRSEDVDLRQYQQQIESVIQGILAEFDQAVRQEEETKEEGLEDSVDSLYTTRGLTRVFNATKRREALLAALSKDKSKEGDADGTPNKPPRLTLDGTLSADDVGSIMTTDADFDPLLFLSVVHGKSTFQELHHGLDLLGGQTDNQVLRLQNLVRDNFALFLRCANGIDLFEDARERDMASDKIKEIFKRMDKMDRLSNVCVNQANNSFTSLLENTTDVRKTQAALAVLERMKSILEVPTLMRNHLEARRFTGAVKAYRRVLNIKEDCQVELLNQVKEKATEIARMAQRDLEQALADPNVSVGTLLDAIRDLRELQSLNVGSDRNPGGEENDPSMSGIGWKSKKALEIVRSNPPALACLLLQGKHFTNIAERSIEKAESAVKLISQNGRADSVADSSSEKAGKDDATTGTSGERNRWRYDILEARVAATVQAVVVTRSWLPRLVRIGVAAYEAEKRDMEPSSISRSLESSPSAALPAFKAYDVYSKTVAPSVIRLVEHATFCSLGCGNSGNANEFDIPMSFGKDADEKVQALLRAPLPATQSAKCATELAELVDVVHNFAISAGHFHPMQSNDPIFSPLSPPSLRESVAIKTPPTGTNLEGPLVACVKMAEKAVVTAERRRCIYAFDTCGRSCAMNASSRGVFDGEVLLHTVQKLSEELTRPQQCANEVERGCQLVIRRCCDGLANYVRERGTSARLRAVSVCANAISGRMLDVVRDVSYLTGGQSEDVQDMLSNDLENLERTLFEEFLESVNRNVMNSVRLGLADGLGSSLKPGVFPSYLSSSLLAITRCRAQVEKALGDTFRRSSGKTYQELAVVSASESMVYGMCNEINSKLTRITSSHADRLANELQFVLNTVKNHVNEETMRAGTLCLQALCKKAGRGNAAGGPVDLSPVEELERLGRVYVLCLAEL